MGSETVKTRMQVSGLGIGQTVSTLYKNEGIGAFWKGILFAYGREISYTSIKLGGTFTITLCVPWVVCLFVYVGFESAHRKSVMVHRTSHWPFAVPPDLCSIRTGP